ncbi:MAG: hypothetical protein QXG12_06900, partial [Thermoproteota archaeon]
MRIVQFERVLLLLMLTILILIPFIKVLSESEKRGSFLLMFKNDQQHIESSITLYSSSDNYTLFTGEKNKTCTSINCSVLFDPIFGDFIISGSISVPVSSTICIWYSPYEIWYSLLNSPKAWILLGNATSSSDGSYYYRVSVVDVGFAAHYKTSWPGNDDYYGAESKEVSISIEESSSLMRNFIIVRLFMIIGMIASERIVNILRHHKERVGKAIMLLLDSSLLTIFYLLVCCNLATILKIIFKLLNVYYAPSLTPELSRLVVFMSIVAFLDSLLYYFPYIFGEKIFRIRKKILLSTFTAGFLIIFFGTFTAMKIT